MGSCLAYDAASRQLAKKLTLLKITKEEYVLMKAILLLNPGRYTEPIIQYPVLVIFSNCV